MADLYESAEATDSARFSFFPFLNHLLIFSIPESLSRPLSYCIAFSVAIFKFCWRQLSSILNNKFFATIMADEFDNIALSSLFPYSPALGYTPTFHRAEFCLLSPCPSRIEFLPAYKANFLNRLMLFHGRHSEAPHSFIKDSIHINLPLSRPIALACPHSLINLPDSFPIKPISDKLVYLKGALQ